MIMKRFLYYIWFLPLMLSGCEKDLMDYEGLEGVYFAVQWGDSWGNENSWPYQPYTDVNFISLPGDTAHLGCCQENIFRLFLCKKLFYIILSAKI